MTASDACTSLLAVRVKPRSRRAGLLGRHGEGVKVAVRAAPERGQANQELVHVVAALLQVERSAVEIVSGATSQEKRLRVHGVSPEELQRRIDAALRSR
ncbi:MAG: DUF167 domain-containing protein [Candidatus Latescibacterota bacterium]|nr:MAG: DUF167 domain-containing protein [Candidatus Latescibacterota bacterium]